MPIYFFFFNKVGENLIELQISKKKKSVSTLQKAFVSGFICCFFITQLSRVLTTQMLGTYRKKTESAWCLTPGKMSTMFEN